MSGRKLVVQELSVAGHVQQILLRTYRPVEVKTRLPIVVYLHGGGFVAGDLDDARYASEAIAELTPAWVISVAYSLAPGFPFPVALEDGIKATRWAIENAQANRADKNRLGVAGHDAGGNIAAGLAAMARDRDGFEYSAQALLAPLLDPSMTRVAAVGPIDDVCATTRKLAYGYRAYLQKINQMMHPYAAPLESLRLAGLPPTFIATASDEHVRIEAEHYAKLLVAAGVAVEFACEPKSTSHGLGGNARTLQAVSEFFRRRLASSLPGDSCDSCDD